MNTDVNTFPDELVTMCAVAVHADPDVADLMPPDEIVQCVLAPEPSDAQMVYYQEWMANRERIWERHETLIERLPEAEGDGLPGWVAEKWAFALHSRWGAGLADAVRRGEEWLEAQ